MVQLIGNCFFKVLFRGVGPAGFEGVQYSSIAFDSECKYRVGQKSLWGAAWIYLLLASISSMLNLVILGLFSAGFILNPQSNLNPSA